MRQSRQRARGSRNSQGRPQCADWQHHELDRDVCPGLEVDVRCPISLGWRNRDMLAIVVFRAARNVKK